MLWYDNDLQAYNSDRWTDFSYQPTPNAEGEGGYVLFQFGNYSYISIKPVTGSGAGTASGSSGIPAWVWGAHPAGHRPGRGRRDVRAQSRFGRR